MKTNASTVNQKAKHSRVTERSSSAAFVIKGSRESTSSVTRVNESTVKLKIPRPTVPKGEGTY